MNADEYVTRKEFNDYVNKHSKSEIKEKKPKRKPSPYTDFVKLHMAKLRKEDPNMPAPVMMKRCGEEWQKKKTS